MAPTAALSSQGLFPSELKVTAVLSDAACVPVYMQPPHARQLLPLGLWRKTAGLDLVRGLALQHFKDDLRGLQTQFWLSVIFHLRQ